MRSLEDILRVLDGVVPKGGGQYMAMCPCHADKRPSLALRMGDKGIVMHCQAGCRTEDVLSSLGLTMRDLCEEKTAALAGQKAESQKAESAAKKTEARPFSVGQAYQSKLMGDDGKQVKRQESVTAVYTYRDKDGADVLQVARTDHKSFPVIHRSGDRWYWGDGGNSAVLYRLPDLLKALRDGRDVYIVEGEKDVETMRRLGFCATTNKGGAGKWKDDLSAVFKNGKVIIIPDLDKAGRKHGNILSAALKKAGVKELRLLKLRTLCADLPDKGDVSDLVEMVGEEKAVKLLKQGTERAIVIARTVDDNDYAEWFDGLGVYSVQNGCISALRGESWQPLCNFTALPVGEVIKDDGAGGVGTSFEIVGWDELGKKLPRISLTAEQFGKMDWPLKHWGLVANIRSGNGVKERLREAIQLAGNRSAVREYAYAHTGWRTIDGVPVYLHGGGAIGAEGVRVDLEYDFERYNLSGAVEGAAAKMEKSAKMDYCIGQTMRLIAIAGERVGIPLISYMFLSPLKHFFEKMNKRPSFIPFIRGRTGSGKSVMASLALNFFGRSFSYEATHPASFEDTANAISLKLFMLKDMPLLIDDYHPESNAARRKSMEEVAQKVSRMVGDGAKRSRMRNDGASQIDRPARGLCIQTGEDLPQVTESGIARLYVIDLKKGDVPLGNEDLTELQERGREGCYCEVMRGYIEWLLPQYEALPTLLDERYKRLLSEAVERTKKSEMHARARPVVAYLMTGYEMMLDYFKEQSFISESDKESFMQSGWRAILHNIERQSREMVDEKPTKLFMGTLAELIDTHRVEMRSFGDMSISRPFESDKENLIGYFDHDYYYLSPGIVFAAVQKALREQGSNFPVTKTMLLKMLADEGLSLRDERTKKSVKQLNRLGVRGWFLWLRRDKLDEMTEEQQQFEIGGKTE